MVSFDGDESETGLPPSFKISIRDAICNILFCSFLNDIFGVDYGVLM